VAGVSVAAHSMYPFNTVACVPHTNPNEACSRIPLAGLLQVPKALPEPGRIGHIVARSPGMTSVRRIELPKLSVDLGLVGRGIASDYQYRIGKVSLL
jgi:hypothetical protein